MGGCQRDIRIHERYNSATVDVASCPRSDGMAMVVSNGGDGLFRWSSGPDHIKPTLGPWCGENGVVSRGRAARRCASARDAKIRATLLHPVQQCHTYVSNRKRMEAMLVESSHPHVSTEGPCGAEQTHDPRAEPACHSGLPYASHALGSGGVAETEQQRCRVATSGQGLKPSSSAHKVGLQFVVGVSPNVGRMAAVIDDDATHGVGYMGSGGVEVRTPRVLSLAYYPWCTQICLRQLGVCVSLAKSRRRRVMYHVSWVDVV